MSQLMTESQEVLTSLLNDIDDLLKERLLRHPLETDIIVKLKPELREISIDIKFDWGTNVTH